MSQENASTTSKQNLRMVFACSGAADVGAISDLAARRLGSERTASMCCTAAISAGITDIIAKARDASKILAIDGCKENCAKKILEQAQFTDFSHLQLGLLGMEKGKTPVTDERVEIAVEQARFFCLG